LSYKIGSCTIFQTVYLDVFMSSHTSHALIVISWLPLAVYFFSASHGGTDLWILLVFSYLNVSYGYILYCGQFLEHGQSWTFI